MRIWIAEAGALAVGYLSVFWHDREQNPFRRSRRWLEIHHVELSSWVFNSGPHQAFRRLGFTPKVVRFGRP